MIEKFKLLITMFIVFFILAAFVFAWYLAAIAVVIGMIYIISKAIRAFRNGT